MTFFDNIWQFFENYCQFWQFVRQYLEIFWQFLTILTTETIFGQFCQLKRQSWSLVTFETLTILTIENLNSWQSLFTWQLIVTQDSICNSCDVFLKLTVLFWFSKPTYFAFLLLFSNRFHQKLKWGQLKTQPQIKLKKLSPWSKKILLSQTYILINTFSSLWNIIEE